MSRRLIATGWLLVLWGCPSDDGGPTVASDAAGPPAVQRASVNAGAGAALLEAVKGQVTLERGSAKTAAVDGYLYVGDAVETGPDGEARVRFAGGRAVELGSDGRFELKSSDSGLILSVSQGLVLTSNATGAPAQPLPGPTVELTIETPFGFTRVGAKEPVDLTLSLTANGARIDVKLGSVDLVATDGTLTRIGAGQIGRFGEGTLALEPIEIVLSPGAGRGELKKSGEARWVALKKAVPLREGDSFRVKGGRVVLQAPGGHGSLAFAAGSEATMDKAASSGTAAEIGLDFKKGELLAQSPLSSRLNLSGGVSLSADGSSQYTLRRTKDGYELQSAAGDLKIERQGSEPATVFGGRAAKIPLKGQVTSAEPARESLALPSRSALKVLQSFPGRLAITWDGRPDQPYRVEVASDPAYKQKVLSGAVRSRFVNLPTPLRGSLYWKVADGAGSEVAKGSASFGPEPASSELNFNQNEVRDGADQSKATIFYQDKVPRVTFAWDASSAAAKYKVQVYRKGELSAPVVEKVVSASEGEKLSLPENALGEGEYFWSLKFLDSKGAEIGGTGKMNKLLIVYDNAVPGLLIKAPRNGEGGGATVRCAGVAPKGSKLFINAAPVKLDESSRFDTEVAPMGGGLLVFRMLNGANEVYTVRKVRKGK